MVQGLGRIKNTDQLKIIRKQPMILDADALDICKI